MDINANNEVFTRREFGRISIADVLSNPEPSHAFKWGAIIPEAAVTLLAGHGGTGKSTFALQLACAIALGTRFMGFDTDRSKVLFFSGEDATCVIRQRLATICGSEGFHPEILEQNLIALDATELALLWDKSGETDAMRILRQVVRENGVDFIVIDNASDTYGADTVDRPSVTQYVRALCALGAEVRAAVLLLGHVNRATAQGRSFGGDNYADSGAWHNAVRSRVFMSADAQGIITLKHEKSNYGRKSDPIAMQMDENGLLKETFAKFIPSPERNLEAIANQVDAYLVSQLKDGNHLTQTTLEKLLTETDKTLIRSDVRAALKHLEANGRVLSCYVPRTSPGAGRRSTYLHPLAFGTPDSLLVVPERSGAHSGAKSPKGKSS